MSEGYDEREIAVRRATKRRENKRKRTLALFLLSFFIILFAAGSVFLFLGGKYVIVALYDHISGLKYIEQESVELIVIDNVFTGFKIPAEGSILIPRGNDDRTEQLLDNPAEDPSTTVTPSPVTEAPRATATPIPSAVPTEGPTPTPTQVPSPDSKIVNYGPQPGYDRSKHKLGLVILDAGHGGYDPGTSNDSGTEKEINISITYLLRDLLEEYGYTVYLTRTDDSYVGLYERARLANEHPNALALISIHQNSVEDAPTASGIETLTYDRSGCRELAAALNKYVSAATMAKNRGTTYKTNLIVTSKVTMPSVILECGYMSNPSEEYLLTTENYQKKIAQGVVDAIMAFADSYY